MAAIIVAVGCVVMAAISLPRKARERHRLGRRSRRR
ncbi:hypothetical protein M2284_003552 [Rhodococcus sp. LBL1]|uniref:Uncharacterized protein n=1 Tax=Prescottella agglutinans TaxID=1644129 RepID=A0ABT6M646_9NOCA|nr:hypothetical protein [Prescottella agglutinans]MDH6679330.1 hypothetical protein [Rhodococcus sp. LBL1]MDH6685529.1 hypothetical protein [Rhodococcus sp. LBL2]